MQTQQVLTYPIHIDTLEGLITTLEEGLKKGRHQHVVTLNPEMLMRGEDDEAFGTLLKKADIVLPDGAGVVWALKRKMKNIQRIPGIEFSQAIIARAAEQNEAIALIGASEEVNKAAENNLKQKYPGLKISYTHHGFFKEEDEKAQIAQACAETKPKYVFVALGVPGQEYWIRDFKDLFKIPTAFVGVGGSFDIWSGLKQRAPEIFLKLNLEWLYRITSEPFRLKRVYKTLPLFVVKVLLHDNKDGVENEHSNGSSAITNESP